MPDVAIVGTGPNGLAAGVTMARAGLSVRLHEAAPDIGGGLRTADLFDSGVRHDICAAVHPMAAASAFFREFDLEARGVELLSPEASYAHPLDGAPAAIAYRDLDRTCTELGPDAAAWRRLMAPLVRASREVVDLALDDHRRPPRSPSAALTLAVRALRHGTPLAHKAFQGRQAAALLAGVAAHAVRPLPSLTGGGVAMLLGHLAHGTGWPVVQGGSARIADALAADIRAHGGTFITGEPVTDLREIADATTVLLDLAPPGFDRIAGPLLPARYRRALARYRFGPGAAKVDFLVDGPIPWRDPTANAAATVHLGGDSRAIWRSETQAAQGKLPDDPFVLVVDPAAADPSRIHGGRRPVWTYTHVPNGDPVDPEPLIRAQFERFAPGFGDTVVASRTMRAPELAAYNPNYVGGDIGAGAMTPWQAVFRPTPAVDPYRTPLRGVYLCSAATPPGPGVHGMSGWSAARSALHREFGIHRPPALGPTADQRRDGIR